MLFIKVNNEIYYKKPTKDVKLTNVIFKQWQIKYYCLIIFFIDSISFEINNVKTNHNEKSSTELTSMINTLVRNVKLSPILLLEKPTLKFCKNKEKIIAIFI